MFEQQIEAIVEWYESLKRDIAADKIAELAIVSGLGIQSRQLHYILSEIKVCENLYHKTLMHSSGYEQTDLLEYFRALEQFKELETQLQLPIESIVSTLYNAIQEVPAEERHWTMDEILKEAAVLRTRRSLRARIRIALQRGNIKRARQLYKSK